MECDDREFGLHRRWLSWVLTTTVGLLNFYFVFCEKGRFGGLRQWVCLVKYDKTNPVGNDVTYIYLF